MTLKIERDVTYEVDNTKGVNNQPQLFLVINQHLRVLTDELADDVSFQESGNGSRHSMISVVVTISTGCPSSSSPRRTTSTIVVHLWGHGERASSEWSSLLLLPISSRSSCGQCRCFSNRYQSLDPIDMDGSSSIEGRSTTRQIMGGRKTIENEYGIHVSIFHAALSWHFSGNWTT